MNGECLSRKIFPLQATMESGCEADRSNLTTLCQDTQHLGQYAAEKLIDLIEKPKTAMRNITIVQGKLYEGQTVLKLDGSRG